MPIILCQQRLLGRIKLKVRSEQETGTGAGTEQNIVWQSEFIDYKFSQSCAAGLVNHER